jgi:hypothetical protein
MAFSSQTFKALREINERIFRREILRHDPRRQRTTALPHTKPGRENRSGCFYF